MTALVEHSRATGGAWTCVGTGASFDSDADALNNTAVADLTAILWLSGSQTTSSVLRLQYLWSTPKDIRTIDILNLLDAGQVPMPAGIKVVVKGRRQADVGYTYSLGGNCSLQRTVSVDNGSTECRFVTAKGNDPLIGYEVAIYNDLNSSTHFTAGQYIYIGEIDAFDAVEIKVSDAQGWQPKFEGQVQDRRSNNNQSRRVITKPYRLQPIKSIPVTFATAYGVSGGTATPYSKLANICAQADVMGVIVQYDDSSGNVDPFALHSTAVYGVAGNLSPPQYMNDGYYTASLEVAEIPP